MSDTGIWIAWGLPTQGRELQALAALRLAAPDAPVRMSGSGACVFAEFLTATEAEAANRRLPADLRRWLAPGLSEHPLLGL